MILFEQDPVMQTEVPKETFFSRLPSALDRQNLDRVLTWIIDASQYTEALGTLLGVGGTLKKRPPRKDIDLLWVPVKFDAMVRKTPYKQATEEFGIMLRLVEVMLQKHPELAMVRKTEPFVDPEFNSESILAHDGSIELRFQDGVPIEIIRSHIAGMEEVRSFRLERREPFTVLT